MVRGAGDVRPQILLRDTLLTPGNPLVAQSVSRVLWGIGLRFMQIYAMGNGYSVHFCLWRHPGSWTFIMAPRGVPGIISKLFQHVPSWNDIWFDSKCECWLGVHLEVWTGFPILYFIMWKLEYSHRPKIFPRDIGGMKQSLWMIMSHSTVLVVRQACAVGNDILAEHCSWYLTSCRWPCGRRCLADSTLL